MAKKQNNKKSAQDKEKIAQIEEAFEKFKSTVEEIKQKALNIIEEEEKGKIEKIRKKVLK